MTYKCLEISYIYNHLISWYMYMEVLLYLGQQLFQSTIIQLLNRSSMNTVHVSFLNMYVCTLSTHLPVTFKFISLQSYGFPRVYRRMIEFNKRTISDRTYRRVIQERVKYIFRIPNKIGRGLGMRFCLYNVQFNLSNLNINCRVRSKCPKLDIYIVGTVYRNCKCCY